MLVRHGGVAPLEASSGRIQRHRLDRGGNRQLNAALYRIAIMQARYHPAARAYLERPRLDIGLATLGRPTALSFTQLPAAESRRKTDT